MKLRTKIITGFVVIVGALVVIPLLLTNFILNRPTSEQTPLLDPPEVVTRNLETTPFNLEEGYSFDRVITWDLENLEASRSVDRYRFKRAGAQGGTFTISFYDQGQYNSFDALISARYGEGFIDETEEFDLNGFTARRVLSSFLDTGNSTDILVQTGENTFISLYSIHTPEGDSSTKILEEINLMQMTFKQI